MLALFVCVRHQDPKRRFFENAGKRKGAADKLGNVSYISTTFACVVTRFQTKIIEFSFHR